MIYIFLSFSSYLSLSLHIYKHSQIVSKSSTTKYYDDLLTLLSGAMTNKATCLDGCAISKNNMRKLIEGRVRRISKHFSNCLPMEKKLKKSETASSRFSTVLLGDVGAGKSSLVLQFVKGKFVEFQESTIGAAFFNKMSM